jgi:hypothetical protein
MPDESKEPDESEEPDDGEERLSMRAELAARDRYLRHKMWQMTPRERLAAMARLMEQSRALLEKNPEAMAHFMRRNFKARATRADEASHHDDE